MRKDRLLKLAKFLETVPDTAFDLSRWQKRAPSKSEGKRPGDCGFAGCAVGWAAHQRMFRGLKLEDDGYGEIAPMYDGLEHWLAVGKLFEISNGGYASSNRQAEHLFMGSEYPDGKATPKQVAKRIRAFVASNGEVK